MNGAEQQALVPLKQWMLMSWAWPQILQYCTLPGGLTKEIFQTLAVAQIISVFNVPK
jgi:hypothetical protein